MAGVVLPFRVVSSWVSRLLRPALLLPPDSTKSIHSFRLNCLLIFPLSAITANPTLLPLFHTRVNDGQRVESRRHQSLHGPGLPNRSVLNLSKHTHIDQSANE